MNMDILPIQPMLLQPLAKPFDSDDYLFEFKFDGVRMLAYNFDNPLLFNRKLRQRTTLYPEIIEHLAQLPKGIVLDGEIIALDNEGAQSFSNILRRDLVAKYNPSNAIAVCFVAFDILYYNFENVMMLPLLQRKELLNNVLQNQSGTIKKVDSFCKIGTMLFETAKQQGLEGIVAKRIDSAYIPATREGGWYKIKCFRFLDAYVGGWQSKTRPTLCLGQLQNNKLFYIGNASNGLTQADWHKLMQRLEKLEVPSSPFENFKGQNATFVKPQIMLKIKYLEFSPDGSLRQPIIDKIY